MSESTMPPDVRLVDVVKEFAEVRAVDGISLEIPRGSFFALLGPSGCGKTTTLRMIGGFEEPTEGRSSSVIATSWGCRRTSAT
jgi:spermidine/putrescine transport system ATP-binding protein